MKHVDDIHIVQSSPVDIESHESIQSNKSDNSNNNYTIIDSKQLRKKIISEKIYPFYIDEINQNLVEIKIWSTMYSIFSTLTIIMISASTIVSFSVPQFPNIHYVSYIAGILGVVALMCERFAHYCSSQSSVSTQRINLLLQSIGVNDTLPDMSTIKHNQNIKSFDDDLTNKFTNQK